MEALLLVDIQNDFMPYGDLPVADGDEVVAAANALGSRFDLVVATQDWHPSNHTSFASNHPSHKPGDLIELAGESQVLWPDHCVQNTPGASFHSGLDVTCIHHVTRKGTDPSIDSYSAFFDNAHKRDTGLMEVLAERGVEGIWIVGLATDYCVKWTALDARAMGLRVTVVEDGVRGVGLQPGDLDAAFEEMRQAGVHVAQAVDAL